MSSPLDVSFFAQPTLAVARELLGACLVHEHPDEGRIVGRVVETEAYGQDDPACHGWHLVDQETGAVKKEGRGAELFGPPGIAYVYLCYGMYHLFNVVTESEGVCGAVLIRALEPVAGLDGMHARRAAARSDRGLTNGPGKLVQALDLGPEHHGTDLTQAPVYFEAGDDVAASSVAISSRIGISRAVERPWRFFIKGHPYVSPGTPSDRR